jgi:hypothetical protein
MDRLRNLLARLPARVRDDGVTWIVLLVVAVVYAVTHRTNIDHPHAVGEGWWRWWDQGHYLRAAHAWAHLDLDPEKHWYFPGYAVIGALFVWLKPAQPFYLPDLIALLAFGWLFVRLAERLAPELRHVRELAALTFLLTVAVSPWMMKSFVEPWTTTPTAPLTYASLLLAFRFADFPSARNAAFLGATTVAVVLFRPTEAMLLTSVIALWASGTLVVRHRTWRETIVVAASGVGGALAPVVLLGGLHVLVYGWALSGYMLQSRSIGFEWSLIPLRWVTLFIAPQPLFTDSVTFGMAGAFPWVVPGIAGLAATILATRGAVRSRHALVAAAIAVHCVVYLAYRDLHPHGLLRYNNYHYFKWLLPLLGLYCVFLFSAVWAHPRRGLVWAGAAAVVLALFCWRAEWAPSAITDAHVEGPQTLLVAQGLPSPRDAIRVNATGTFTAKYMDNQTLRVGDATYVVHSDFKVYPTHDGVIVVPLRPLPAGESVFTFNSGITLDESVRPELGRQAVTFGLPMLVHQALVRVSRMFR